MTNLQSNALNRRAKKPCLCGARQFPVDDNIQFCPDCAPNKSLAAYRDQEQRRKNPELPLVAAPTPASLRAQADALRQGAEYADDRRARQADLDRAAELEADAANLEAQEVAA